MLKEAQTLEMIYYRRQVAYNHPHIRDFLLAYTHYVGKHEKHHFDILYVPDMTKPEYRILDHKSLHLRPEQEDYIKREVELRKSLRLIEIQDRMRKEILNQDDLIDRQYILHLIYKPDFVQQDELTEWVLSEWDIDGLKNMKDDEKAPEPLAILALKAIDIIQQRPKFWGDNKQGGGSV